MISIETQQTPQATAPDHIVRSTSRPTISSDVSYWFLFDTEDVESLNPVSPSIVPSAAAYFEADESRLSLIIDSLVI